MWRYRLYALIVLIAGGLLAWFVFSTNHAGSRYATHLGLDLAGGTELIYRADTSNVVGNKSEVLSSLREVIERRVNLFGVAEPIVQVQSSSAVAAEQEDRIIVDLPGVTDVSAAVAALGKTPLLEFKFMEVGSTTTVENGTAHVGVSFVDTGLTGQYLKDAKLQFGTGQSGGLQSEPTVVLEFTDAGAKLFSEITTNNVGKTLAIMLDGNAISTPVIREPITGGSAVVSGNFTPASARDLVRNLNFGALPVPISLVGSQTIGSTLGTAAFSEGLRAAIIGFALVALFMVLWYRIPGVIASLALIIYVLMNIAIIKFIPITLTASGIAGFILSIGMAVDANVLVFERMKEELRSGKGTREAVHIGFSRAWPAIRDGHLTMLISAVILFWLGTGIVKGFALVFGFGILASLLSAVTISRVFLLAILPEHAQGIWRFLVGSGHRIHHHK